uniref:KIND domain-containing protein n=1 Tax=Salarias fasciatus TaxID=181472 RepID=A0A672HH72_SALFA
MQLLNDAFRYSFLLQENVSLADILSLRDSCLSEEEVWAVCVECALALQSIRPSHLFHTLCITPDTLAFNAHGNVCFMEQLSDDPEGSFVPPEFDSTGSTFEGHVYSLGSTLSAALSFVIEPELEANLGEEIQRLLEQMQEEKPEDRPLLQDILSEAEARLSRSSSAAVCRKLSSVGRRVLSIESVSNFQGYQVYRARFNRSLLHSAIPSPAINYLTEIGTDEHLSCCKTVWSNKLQRLNRGKSCESYPLSIREDCGKVFQRNEDSAEILCIEERETPESQPEGHYDVSPPSSHELEMDRDPAGDQGSSNHILYTPNNHMTKSMLCLNEESQDEWISLRELLTRCERRLTVNELWALCSACLSSLQTYIDFPAYLCLDTVYVGCEGEVLFLKPKNVGILDEFYLAPEYQEHGIVTEKVCLCRFHSSLLSPEGSLIL